MTRHRPILSRFCLAFLVALVLSFQGVPLVKAEMVTPVSEAAAPCHDMADQSAPKPAKPDADPFACCATFACGMMVQALPPDPLPERRIFVTRFDRPAGAEQAALSEPDPAWRPPATFFL
ncbi:hypothetical protein [Dongia sp.]|uniref:hypothetical protein n=1 Tax=Dongia sp. TaxID=1977262 RepID=UPI0035AEC6B5